MKGSQEMESLCVADVLAGRLSRAWTSVQALRGESAIGSSATVFPTYHKMAPIGIEPYDSDSVRVVGVADLTDLTDVIDFSNNQIRQGPDLRYAIAHQLKAGQLLRVVKRLSYT